MKWEIKRGDDVLQTDRSNITLPDVCIDHPLKFTAQVEVDEEYEYGLYAFKCWNGSGTSGYSYVYVDIDYCSSSPDCERLGRLYEEGIWWILSGNKTLNVSVGNHNITLCANPHFSQAH